MDKKTRLKRLQDLNGNYNALAIDQRNAIFKMFAKFDEARSKDLAFISSFKALVSKNLTPHCSAILLDPIYGLEAIKVKSDRCGLLLALEESGYSDALRTPKIMDGMSTKKLKELGADGLKFLLYYDADDVKNNASKQELVREIGKSCEELALPFFLEILVYEQEGDYKHRFAKYDKILAACKEFSQNKYGVDVLKVEIPIDMSKTQGFCEEQEFLFSKKEAEEYFLKLNEACGPVGFVFLSAGVSASMFRDSLRFAKEAGSKHKGVLCGRATWAPAVKKFCESEREAALWLQSDGLVNLCELSRVLEL